MMPHDEETCEYSRFSARIREAEAARDFDALMGVVNDLWIGRESEGTEAAKLRDKAADPWISVEDEMPGINPAVDWRKESVEVLGTDGTNHAVVTHAWPNIPDCYAGLPTTKKGRWSDDEGNTYEITHWAPLPKPPT